MPELNEKQAAKLGETLAEILKHASTEDPDFPGQEFLGLRLEPSGWPPGAWTVRAFDHDHPCRCERQNVFIIDAAGNLADFYEEH